MTDIVDLFELRREPITFRSVLGEVLRRFLSAPWCFIGLALLIVDFGLVQQVVVAAVRHDARSPLIVLLLLAFGLVLAAVCQATAFVGTQRLIEGRAFAFGESAREALARTPALAMTSILTVVLAVLGLVCLVVPGVVVAIGASVAYPACVIERLGPWAALRRSWRLTSGRRWGLAGLFVLLLLLAMVVVTVIVVLAVASLFAAESLDLAPPITLMIAGAVIHIGFVLFGTVAFPLQVILFRRLGGGATSAAG